MIRTVAEVVGATLLVLLGFYALLCIIVGPFLVGEHVNTDYIGDGCVRVEKVYTNWYPSNDKVLSTEVICD